MAQAFGGGGGPSGIAGGRALLAPPVENYHNRSSESDTEGLDDSWPAPIDWAYRTLTTEDLEELILTQTPRSFSITTTLLLSNNALRSLPLSLSAYTALQSLDLSFNTLTELSESLLSLKGLVRLVARNNFLHDGSFPKGLSALTKLREINLSGNQLTRLPEELLEVAPSLISLHIGGNRLGSLGREIGTMRNLEFLYLGGNSLTELPPEVGLLKSLRVFVLCENRLESLPASVASLRHLKSLLLHRNRLTALPVELIKLRNLMELSLRDNPLVVRFVRDMVHNPPSLMELAARTVKIKRVPYTPDEIPKDVMQFLTCAHECVNPRCKGVYFNSCVEHIKFVDFCGKYRVPLLQYLCSTKCSDHQSPAYERSDSSDSEDDLIRKVLLG